MEPIKIIEIQAVLTIGKNTNKRTPFGGNNPLQYSGMDSNKAADTWRVTFTHTIADVEKCYSISWIKTSNDPGEEMIPVRAALAQQAAVALGIGEDLTQDVNVVITTDILGIELKNEKLPLFARLRHLTHIIN